MLIRLMVLVSIIFLFIFRNGSLSVRFISIGSIRVLESFQIYSFNSFIILLYFYTEPFENDGSFSPIREDGTYDYVDWWANDVYDPVTPVVYGFIWPNANGNCLPTLGGPGSAIPQGMYDNSVAWIRQDRVNTLALNVDPPAPGTNEAIDIVITGIPVGETASKYTAVVYARTNTGLIGPLPTCGTTYDLIQDPNIPSQAQLHVRDWSTGNVALVNTATGFRIGLVPEPFRPAGEQCLLNAANIPVSAPTIVEAEVLRVPSPSPSPSSSPSGSPSSSPSVSSSVSESGSPSTSTVPTQDIFKGASSGAKNEKGINLWTLVVSFGLVALAMVFGNNFIAAGNRS